MNKYLEAGVDIDAGNLLVKETIIPAIKSTARPGFPVKLQKPMIWNWKLGFKIKRFGLEISGSLPIPKFIKCKLIWAS